MYIYIYHYPQPVQVRYYQRHMASYGYTCGHPPVGNNLTAAAELISLVAPAECDVMLLSKEKKKEGRGRGQESKLSPPRSGPLPHHSDDDRQHHSSTQQPAGSGLTRTRRSHRTAHAPK